MQKLLKDTEEKMKKSMDVVTRQFGEVRGGRANPALVEHLTVPYYGTPTPLKQLAAITAPEPRMLVVQAWDATAIVEIEKAILQSNLGISPQVDGKIIRLPIPPLTVERRQQLTKLLPQLAEEGRIAVRTIRRDANEVVKKLKADKQISEDDSFKNQDAVQKLTDRVIAQIDSLLKVKEQEVLSV
ncbi:MAG: ribosome recycling factor [Candidatus Omnitrophica bacterium]|nr:ribosome recycling factor [Candidatus Omnitrophota bacterium]